MLEIIQPENGFVKVRSGPGQQVLLLADGNRKSLKLRGAFFGGLSKARAVRFKSSLPRPKCE
jgi:hypothetical protein